MCALMGSTVSTSHRFDISNPTGASILKSCSPIKNQKRFEWISFLRDRPESFFTVVKKGKSRGQLLSNTTEEEKGESASSWKKQNKQTNKNSVVAASLLDEKERTQQHAAFFCLHDRLWPNKDGNGETWLALFNSNWIKGFFFRQTSNESTRFCQTFHWECQT